MGRKKSGFEGVDSPKTTLQNSLKRRTIKTQLSASQRLAEGMTYALSSLPSPLRREAAAAESAANPVPNSTTVIGSGIVTGAGGAGVSVGAGGASVAVAVAVGGSAGVVGVAVGGSAGVVGVAVGGSVVAVDVGGSVGCVVGVSAEGSCAKTCAGWDIRVNESIRHRTAPQKNKYKDLDCLMGDSPVQAIKPTNDSKIDNKQHLLRYLVVKISSHKKLVILYRADG